MVVQEVLTAAAQIALAENGGEETTMPAFSGASEESQLAASNGNGLQILAYDCLRNALIAAPNARTPTAMLINRNTVVP